MKIKDKANQLKKQVPAVFLVLKNKQTPWYAKALAGITVAYALSPIDLIPDFIPILGLLDDVLILPILIILTVKCIPKKIWTQSLEQSEDLWKDGKPKRWFYAIPILLIWLTVLYVIIKAIYN